MNKKIGLILWVIVCIALIGLIGYVTYTNIRVNTDEVIHPTVSFEIENYGTIKLELYPEYAPNTVANFIKLAEAGYYNGKVIYGKDGVCLYTGRNVDGTVENPKVSLINSEIEKDSEQDYEYEIAGEFIANGFEKNTLSHEKGVVSLIRSDYTSQIGSLVEESYNSGNSQLGFMMSDNRNINGVYAAFGKVIEGLDILEKINTELEIEVVETEGEETEATDTEEDSLAIKAFAVKPVIKNASVETYGVEYGMPSVNRAFDYNSYLYELLNAQYAQ